MPNLKEFSLSDLKTATGNFKTDSLLGEGCFGKVFKGWITPCKVGTGMVVAIENLSSKRMLGFQWQTVQSELNFLGKLSHPHLVKVLGYCWEEKEKVLVYEYMHRASLENHLFRRNPNIEPLSWDIRLKIAIGAARGLAFLHTLENEVIYRGFKSSNMLLDGNYNAKISAFGLAISAKLWPKKRWQNIPELHGLFGYACDAPEYLETGHFNLKSGVYGFGVVLLEILTGLRALDRERPSWQQNLVEWLKPSLSNERKLKTIMDTRMKGQYSSKAVLQAAELTLKCLALDPKGRPSMIEVAAALECIEAIKGKPEKYKINSNACSSRPTP